MPSLVSLAQSCARGLLHAYKVQEGMFISPYADEAWAWIRTSLKQRNVLATRILIARLKEREKWGDASNCRSDGTSFFVWDARAMNYAIGELYRAASFYDSSNRPIGVADTWVRGIAEHVSYTSRDELLFAVFGGVAELDPDRKSVV